MLSKKIESALNEQMNCEFYSRFLYLAMAAHFETLDLHGFARWMKVQAVEESDHAMKLFDYIHSRGGRAVIHGTDTPPQKWGGADKVFEASLEHEQSITRGVHKLVDLAAAEKDHATSIFLQWFVTEQVEEESAVLAILEKLKMLKTASAGLFLLDRELGARQ